ncbi:MAG TPA: uroporphyrinogen decarboxylase [Candidatus Acidoferrales bacterium]|nr:uroporphyrinogen decarboxylase [Candidatus Acidoferrales bacterium]
MKESLTVPTRKSLFLRACRGEAVERVPVWMMRQAGRYLPEYRELRQKHPFLEVCKTPDLTVEVSLQPFRRLGMDVVIVFSDILIPAEAMGMALELNDAGPVLPCPLRTSAQMEALQDFDPEQKTHFVPDAIRGICREVGPDVPVIGFAAAPWTLACYMIEGRSRDGFPTAKSFLYQEPRLVRVLLDKIARVTARYLKAQIAAGAAAVQLFDTWCGELGRREYAELALPATELLIAELRQPGVPIILYTKNSAHLLREVAQSGADVLSVDWRVDLGDLRRQFGPRVALQGNVDPCILLGTAEGIRAGVNEAIEKTGGVGHIMNLGHGILPETSVENARLFVETAQSAKLPAGAGAGAGKGR